MRYALSIPVLAIAFLLSGPSRAADIDWTKVDAALGKTASVQGEVHRYGIPRSDLQVTLDGVAIKPALALGGWFGFEPIHDGALVMGDLVLTEAEVNPVMSKLLENGIEITAVHNHLMRANPATFFMHIHGHGDPVAMATAIHAALTHSKTPFGAAVASAAPTTPIGLDTDKLDAAIGAKGKVNGGVYQFSVPREEPITDDGMPIPPAMGTAIAINFQPSGGTKAAITGDFVVTAAELNPMILALRENGIEVTAIHNHMLDEQPRLFFVHFWANDDAVKLARAVRTALDKTAVAQH